MLQSIRVETPAPVRCEGNDADSVGVPLAQAAGDIWYLPVWGFISPLYMQHISGELSRAARAGARCIVLLVNSPGGVVLGVKEVVDTIRNSPVPVFGYVGDMALSGSYWIASQCSVLVGNSALTEVGSVGAYVSYLDDQRWMQKHGYKIVDIYATRSVEKNLPYRKAAEGDYSLIQSEELDPIVEEFIGDVARARGDRIADMAAISRGGVLRGQSAVDAGWLDGVMGWDDFMAMVEEKLWEVVN